ncbi:TetR/AcrR family transcriptional regulator [Pseudonocardia sp. N23]|uniref:TetR/AcrR family transcriptional regulator n=1 Tax=Pseudonocardia sp. N23 TaxID=1987376 RepID=UPI000BFE40B5|nr:TetR-like C-terminal domain-containing protein [Pseudonocardia sp. N23]GAY10070.1 transcriptional regulator, tetr family [Pseudonocardia sp. N23]
MPRPKVHDEALRARLLEQAGETLSTQGLDALSLRRLAADADTSTTAVYSLFGGKPALLTALVDEAFRRLAAHLERVRTTDDPVEDLVALGLAYRDSALADPRLYDVMFGAPVDAPAPGVREGDRSSAQAFAPLRRAADRAAAAGRLRPGAEPETVTLAVWATLHGLTSAELRGVGPGCADDVKVVFETVLRATVAGWGG